MAAPAGSGTRLDAAIDAAVAVAAVAEELGDRCGTLAFAGDLLRTLSPRRRGTDAIVRALFDLEPVAIDSDYARAFRWVGGAKHAFVLVLTDLLDETAAQPLLDALPVLARRHTVAVAAVTDSDLQELVDTRAREANRRLPAAVALDVLATRRRTVTLLRRAGADVVEAPAGCAAGRLRQVVSTSEVTGAALSTPRQSDQRPVDDAERQPDGEHERRASRRRP